MLVKLTDGNLHVIEGTLTPAHEKLGYSEVDQNNIQTDAKGNYYSHYVLNNGVYEYDEPTALEAEAEAQRLLDNADARSYLLETDWYLLRNLEAGTPVPAEVSTKRAEARAKVKHK